MKSGGAGRYKKIWKPTVWGIALLLPISITQIDGDDRSCSREQTVPEFFYNKIFRNVDNTKKRIIHAECFLE
jgi:hypothetical protein